MITSVRKMELALTQTIAAPTRHQHTRDKTLRLHFLQSLLQHTLSSMFLHTERGHCSLPWPLQQQGTPGTERLPW